jgi:hypothetical protein
MAADRRGRLQLGQYRVARLDVAVLPIRGRSTAAVRAVMAMAGFATPFGKSRPTFKFFGLPLKLDWIYLKGLSSSEWSVDDVKCRIIGGSGLT